MDASIFLRLNETIDTLRPVDEAEGLNDFRTGAELGFAATTMPPIVDGVIGPARSFGGVATPHGLVTDDRISGNTLHQRNLSIQVIARYDIALATGGNAATLIARGTNSAANQYHPWALEIRRVNLANKIGELRWVWSNSAGIVKEQIGAHFQAVDKFVMFTATRRWVSSNELVLRYYIGDTLIGEVPSVDGDIGGGTTGNTTLGMRMVAGVWSRWFGGRIDELRVVPRELAPEEIAATARRISVSQPAGYTLIREMHDPGFPISNDPDSRVQRETRLWGDALGYASAQADNMRENVLPDRAYGETLEQWEDITKKAPRANDSTELRRARVVSRLSQKAGVSIPGIQNALREIVDTNPESLEFLSFDQTTIDWQVAGGGLNTTRWFYNPSAQFTIAADKLRVQNAADIPFTSTVKNWDTAIQAIGGEGISAEMFCKLTPTTLAANTEVGIFFGDQARNHYFLFGQRNDAGTYRFITEMFVDGVSQLPTLHAAFGGVLQSPWFHLKTQAVPGFAFQQSASWKFTIRYATAAITGPYTEFVDLGGGYARNQVAGIYARTLAGAANIDASFSDVRVRAPFGERASRWYVYRDPALVGNPDIKAGELAVSELAHAYTKGHLVTSKVARYDDANTGYDITPMGAI